MRERAPQPADTKIGDGAGTVLLVLLLLASVTASIDAANWTDGLGVITWAVLGGFGLGWLLAETRVRGSIAHLASLLVGGPVALFSASLLLPDTLTALEKLTVLQQRFQFWYDQVSANQYGNDALVFIVQLAFLLWIVAYAAAWSVFRRHLAWGAIVPAGIALLINLFFAAPQSGLYLAVYLLCSLILLVRINLRGLETLWRRAAIGYTSDIHFDFLLYGSVFALIFIGVAWFLPPSAPGPSWLGFLDPLDAPWQDVENQFSRLFNTLNAVARPPSSSPYGSSLLMGGPVHLSTQPVMDIQTDSGRYWRAATYDQYTGNGWIDSQTATLDVGAGDPQPGPDTDQLRTNVTQTVQLLSAAQDVLFAESRPIRFPDLPTQVRYLAPAGDSNASPDPTLIRSRRPLLSGDTYTVVSSVSMADADSLRAAPAQYPDWMLKAYVGLPATVPSRVRNLAVEITQNAGNPFDRAIDIEEYLRSHIQYDESVSAPPAGRDAVDYTLFDRPAGYCNYYASAMAVLARLVGIPARVASGYAFGDYKDGVFHVVEANAHAWPELYFPNYGWIAFEPTANQPDIVWPTQVVAHPNIPDEHGPDVKPPGPARGNLGDLGRNATSSFFLFDGAYWREPQHIALAAFAAIALLALGLIAGRQRRRTRAAARLTPAAHVYEAMLERAHWLGIRDQTYATPLERARVIGSALPQAQRPVADIASYYTREKFGARGLDEAERAVLAFAWVSFSGAWRRALLARTVERFVKPPRQLATRLRIRLEHWGGASPR